MTQRYVYAFSESPDKPDADLISLLGGKGASLAVMAGQLRLPVPPGFTITTEACREYLGGSWPSELDEELRAAMERLAERAGRRFGDLADPLLVSVRSGASVSMPGMMDTVLNLGLNDGTAAGLARAAGGDFAADCLRRFRDGYTAVVGSTEVPDDPWVQLRAAIEAVFRSWNSQRAVAYRRREGIADDRGTAATVQAMVFGNRGADSGTGVLFTRNPSTGEPVLFGDVMFDAQGEDVVAGGQTPSPLIVLDERLPEVAAELRRHCAVLERHYADMCDVEFTIEQGRLWMLQVRVGKRSPRAALRIAADMAEDPDFPLSAEEAVRRVAGLLADPPRVFVASGDAPVALTTGLPASPGVATGAIATSSDAAIEAADDGQAVILVRPETSPEDVRGMARAAGVLTSRGGLASHAAVVARGWGVPAVVGAEAVVVADGRIEIDGRELAVGEVITIDGSTGAVYAGELEGTWHTAPEAATLLEWAAELGIVIGSTQPEAEQPDSAQLVEATSRELATDDVMRALLIKGSAAPEQLAASLGATQERVKPVVRQLASEGDAEWVAGSVRLSAEGRLKTLALYAQDRSAVGEERSAKLLEQFHAFDGRMKEIVTAWQLRDVAGEQVLNDHSDAGYDERVLDDLGALHDDTAAWLAPLAERLPRFDVYRTRLSRARDQARGGDQRFVASSRVDSYHSVWFELHEGLIRLAGRKRSDEAG